MSYIDCLALRGYRRILVQRSSDARDATGLVLPGHGPAIPLNTQERLATARKVG